MGYYTDIKARVQEVIRPNGVGAITASDHQKLLLDFVDKVESNDNDLRKNVAIDREKLTELESELGADIVSIYGEKAVEIGFSANNTNYGAGLRGLNHRINADVLVNKVVVNGKGSANFYEMSKNSDGTFKIVQDLGLYMLSDATTLNVNWSLTAGNYIAWGSTGSGIGFKVGSNLTGLSFGSSISNVPSIDSLEWDVKIYGTSVGLEQIRTKVNEIAEQIPFINTKLASKLSEKPSVNIINPQNIKDGYGLGTKFQEYKLGDGFCISDYIEVKGNNISGNTFNRSGYASFVVYDKDYNPIRAVENNSLYVYEDGDCYVRLTFNHEGKVNKLYANYGNTLASYQPYSAIGGYINEIGLMMDSTLYKFGNTKTPSAYKVGIIQAVCADMQIPINGILESISIVCNSDSCFDLVTYKRNADTTWSVESYLASIKCVAGNNTIQIEAPVRKGEYIGFNITDTTSSIGYTTDGSCGELGAGKLKLKGKHITMNGTSNNYCIECAIKADSISDGVAKLNHATSLVDTDTNADFFISNGFNGFDATTENACVYYKEKTWLDKFVEHIEFKLNKPEDSRIVLCQPSGDARNSGGYYVSLDTSTKKLSIHSNWNGNTAAEPGVFASVDIPFEINSTQTYIMDVIVDSAKTLTARITNRFTQQYVEVSDITTGDSHYHGNGVYCGVLLKKGHINITRFKIYSDAPVRPTLAIYGDSFCQGYNLLRGGEDINLRYPQLIKDYLNGDVTIICKGGRTSVDMEEIMDSDMNLIVGKYTLLAIGLNNNIVSSMSLDDFKVSMSKLINKIRRSGSEPILVTYPRLGTDSLSEQYNSWISTYIPMKYLDVREATAVKEGAYGTIDQTLYLEDGHPNAAGNKKIFDRFVIDFGDMKSDL